MNNTDPKYKLKNQGKMNFEFNLKNELVFDVGLNLGAKAQYLLESGASVVGFEPQEDCYREALNKLFFYSSIGSFKAENIALSESVGFADFYRSNAHTISSMSTKFIEETKKQRFSNYNWETKISVPTSTLDLAISKYGKPKYIKIDVEGFELSVLKGLTSPVDYISIEFTPEIYSESEKCLNYLFELNSGQCKFNYVYKENDHYFFDEWLDIDSIKSYLSNVNDFVNEFGDIYIKSF